MPKSSDYEKAVVVEAKIIEGSLRLTYRLKRQDRTFDWEFKDIEMRNRVLEHFNKNRCRTLDQILCEGFDWEKEAYLKKNLMNQNIYLE